MTNRTFVLSLAIVLALTLGSVPLISTSNVNAQAGPTVAIYCIGDNLRIEVNGVAAGGTIRIFYRRPVA